MDDNFSIIKIIHTDGNLQKSVEITVDSKYESFLKNLFEQYGEFSVKQENDKIVITTK